MMFIDAGLLLLGIGLGCLISRLGSRWKSLQEGEHIVHPGLAQEYHYSQAPRLSHGSACHRGDRRD
ncbi:MAG TPA: hypothetical protein VJ914_02080 [Pseudonocardiaceae bacterium]|nr:hypothetical protein [Pseudonocardiaceae bacterium]